MIRFSRLLMGVIIGMFIWNMVLASSLLQPLFGLVSGGWYFLLLLWFFVGTDGSTGGRRLPF